jgi:PAS domain S-box-containing protein
MESGHVTPWAYVLPFAVSVAVTCFLTAVVWRRRTRIPAARDFALWLGAQSAWAFAYVLELRAPSVSSKLFWDDVQWLFCGPMIACGVVFAFRSADEKPKVVRWVGIAAITSIGLLVSGLVAASVFGSLRASARIEYSGDVPALIYDFTPLDDLAVYALYAWMFVPVWRLVRSYRAQPASHRRRTAIVLLGILAPAAAAMLALADVRIFGQRDSSPLWFAAAGTVIYWGILRHGLFDIVPIARAAVLDAIPDCVFVLDVLDRVVGTNAAARKLVDEQDIIGSKAAEVVPCFAEFDVRAATPVTSRAHYEGRALATSVLPLWGPEGRRLGTALVLRDETELEKLNDALESRVQERTAELSSASQHLADSEAKLRAVFDGVHTLIGLLDTDGRVVAANRTALELGGEAEAHVLGRAFADTAFWAHDARERQRFLAALANARAGKTTRFETTHRAASGEIRVIDFVLTPFRDEAGQVTWLIPEGTDITELRRSEAERSELRRRLEHGERLEALGRVASGVAHDFNNLLSVISGSAELLALDFEPADPRAALVNDLRTAAASASRLTKPLLAFARPRGTGVAVFEVDAQLETLVPMLRRLGGSGISLELTPGAESQSVRMELGEFDQVIVNLVVNAQQALGERGHIEIRTFVEEQRMAPADCVGSPAPPGRYLVTTVKDDGPGIPEDVRKHVFEPFFTTKRSGSGLGLASVYALTARAGGQVCMHSSPSRGTCIGVYLPIAEKVSLRPAVTAAAHGRLDLSVLLVDDDLEVRSTARRLLERLGCKVVQAETADEALSVLERRGNFDVLITDVSMPDKSGTEVAAQALRAHPNLRVVVMSGRAPNEEVDGWVAAGRADFVQKPFSMASLERVLVRGADKH